MKLWKQVLAAISAGIVGLSGLQLPFSGGNLLCVSADELTDGLEFTVSGGEATVTGCSSTASEIVIPSEYAGYPVTAIGDSAFYDCDTLVSVTIPQGVTTLEDYAFGYCDNLSTIYMPVSVTSWGYGVSYDCLSLSDVYYEGTSADWESIAMDDGNGYLLWGSTTHYNYVYPDTDTSDDMENIVDGLTFTVSGSEATVTGCSSTASEIVIPSEYAGYPVTAIGDSAFYDCDTLVSVTIPQGVTTLGDYAFGYCDYLTTIYMPVSVTSWGYGVSYDCLSLSDVYYSGTSEEWENIDQGTANGYLQNIATIHYNSIETVTTTVPAETTAPVEITVETTTTTTVAEEKSVWSLGKMTVQPEDGMEEDLNFDVRIDNAISSYGLQGAIYLPEVTAKLLCWPYMESSALLGDVYSSARLTTNMNEVLYNEGEEIYFALDSSTLMTPETDSGVLMQLTFAVPDEDTVGALAEEYGLQMMETEDGTYCYEFPVCWMENGYDEAISDGETIALPRYAYIDSDNQDVFSDNVILEDGYIRVEMPFDWGVAETTTTVADTTEIITTTTVTTSATTIMMTTTNLPTSSSAILTTTSATSATEAESTWTTERITTASEHITATTSYVTTSYATTSSSTTTRTTADTTDSTMTTAATTNLAKWISVAADTVEITLDELRENEFQVSVPFVIPDNPGFRQLAFGASWDTANLTLESCRSDAENLVFTPDVNETDGGSVWLPFMSVEINASGDLLDYTGTALCTLTFTVSEDARPGDMYTVFLDYEGKGGGTAGAESDESLSLELISGAVMIAPEAETDTSTTETTDTTATTETTTTATTTTATMTGTTDVTTETSTVMSADTATNTTVSDTTETTTITTPTSENISGLYIMLGKPDESQLYVGNSFHLLYATNAKNLIWKSTDESIATVDEEGVLTILGSGTVSVIVIVQEDPTQTDAITIVIPETAETTDTTADTSGTTDTSTTTTTTTTTSTSTATGLRGDVDLDGDVDADDAYQVLVYYARHSVGDTAYTFQENAALEAQVVQQADVNQSGTVDADDAYLILCYYARVSVGITDIRWEDLM